MDPFFSSLIDLLPGGSSATPVDFVLLTVLLLPSAVLTVKLLYGLASFVTFYARRSQLPRYIHSGGRGRPPWALVTGSSDGIGVHLARELAAAGLNVVLHGRNEEKLARVKESLEQAFPARQFRSVAADAGALCLTPTAVDRLVADHLADLHLTVLVNNAGGPLAAPESYAALAEVGSDRLAGNVLLNAVFPLLLTARSLPLLQRSGGPALVLNVGSFGDNGLPFMASYGPSKAFLTCLTTALQQELAILGDSDGSPDSAGPASVEVLSVRLGPATGVSYAASPPSFFEPDARTIARAILARVGCGHAVVIPYWPHALLHALVYSLPPRWVHKRINAVVLLGRRTAEREQQAKSK